MKATEQYFPVVLFITLYKVVLTFESVDEILSTLPFVVPLQCAVQVGSYYKFHTLAFNFPLDTLIKSESSREKLKVRV